MRISYIISAYKQPGLLTRLVHRLQGDSSSFLIHVDRRTPQRTFNQMQGDLQAYENVRFLPRHRCYWGGFGHVAATLKGIAALVEGDVPFDYAILLTGQDYPIKPTRYISAMLEGSGGKAFIDYHPLPYSGWEDGGLPRIRYWHFRPFGRYFRFPPLAARGPAIPVRRLSPLALLPFVRRSFPAGFWPFGGSSYWCLPRLYVEYIFEFVRRHHDLVNFFKYVDVPDELFFQTIILNSPLKDEVVNDDLRHILWKDANAASPAILSRGDLEGIRRSRALFARKFDPTVDREILDLIDREFLAAS